ncbi:MMPL family transporter [Mycolicibacterium septicum]|uniref:MMPL/RND family transporter n=1 Tax=Mycolicibacterium septicum TaxID=98668 RepID=UPI0023E2CDF9|nr:MMPL family transporter [Mycolicibacterium septicum]MDF3337963.1 MMPL family transporter [Mycolicibacterium septicum]
MSNHSAAPAHSDNPSHKGIARVIRVAAIPIILAWVGLVVVLNALVPQLEVVGHEHAVSLSPQDAPALVAMKKIGDRFDQFDSDTIAMVVLEGEQPLGTEAHHYYDELVRTLQADTKHVQHVQNYWGDLITAAGSQSTDGKAAYVQVNLAGNQGETLANESVASVRKIIDDSNPPAGVKAYVTGQGPLTTDMNEAGDKSMVKITFVTIAVIAVMLIVVYRSIATMLLMLIVVLLEMSAARGVVAAIGHAGLLGLSTFSVSLLTSLAIAAGTDYAIFLVGRYQEARQKGEEREDAYYTAFHGVGHVILGSGLTVAGAMLCLHFTRLNYFSSMGIPSSIGMSVVVLASLTLAPAMLVVGSRFGLLDAKREIRSRGWRRLGTSVVRWPVPILAAAIAVALVGLLALPGYKTSYNERLYIPKDLPSNVGYAAAERHFTAARMNPDLLLVDAGRDLRNPADMIVLDKIARELIRVPGVARVQSITRPLGRPIAHSSVPFQVSMQSVSMTENLQFLRERMGDMNTLTDDLGRMIVIMENMLGLMNRMTGITHELTASMNDMQASTNEMRDHMADFDDFMRPMRNYLYWEPHCYDIPMCHSMRSLFDGLDGIDTMTETLSESVKNMNEMDQLMPQLVAQLPPMIAISKSMQGTMKTMFSTFNGLIDQIGKMTDTASVMGQAFDDARNDDSFYLPPEAFDNPDFKRGLALMVSPDGQAAQFIITHDVDPATSEGISHVEPILKTAREAIKTTPLADAKIYLGGTAATYKDIQVGAQWDLLISACGAITLIFIVMLLITRALIASFVIVGTVIVSLAASFGLSVLVWQYLLGIDLHWMTLAFSVIILLAVGSDYNLLVVSRMKEEISAGINTGIIRAMGATGGVVTAAGLVFAFTMASMATSDLIAIGQGGTTIGLGLLFDTLVVRSLMTPTIAAILGRWFWWPLPVRQRPARFLSDRTTPIPVARTS